MRVSAQNLILPAGDQKIGKFDWNVALNASPVLLERINDLPVKKVNGTVIFLHDVAYVHDGAPPQTNLVRVNGVHAVLMTILKAGSASTSTSSPASRRCCRAWRRACRRDLACTRSAISRYSSRPRCSASCARRCSPPPWSA